MKLSLGIIGLPNVGKSSLFKLLTKNDIHIANYPFCTIDPNVGIVPVPDERIQKLSELSKSEKQIPAIVEFYDIAGLVRGAHKGEGLGNQFLTHISETHAIVHVIRCFQDSDITHVDESIHPLRDRETIINELILRDLETVERRMKKLEAEAKTGDREKKKQFETAQKIHTELEAGNRIITFANESVVKEMQLLSAKKQIYVLNGRESDIPEELIKIIHEENSEYVIANIKELQEFPELIITAYKLLDLISFFTTGKTETRAWTTRWGSTAPQAAGVIHSDFEQKFIRAEVVTYKSLIAAGSWNNAQKQGNVKTEGKTYIIQDGDVILIRHGA